MEITQHRSYPWLLVLCYSAMGIFFPASVTQFSMVVSELADALQVSSTTILLADTFRAVCLFSAMFLSGYVYRRFGLRRTMTLGICFQILPQFCLPLAVALKSVPLLFLFKGMQGLNAMAFPLYISTITLWMDKRYTALATAIFNGSFTAGSGVGAWIAGRVIPAFGWISSFYVIGVICTVFAIPVLLITRDKPAAASARPAAPAEQARPDCAARQSVYREIVRQPVTWLLVLALLANTWVSQAVTVDMSVYAQDIGYTYGQTGNLMLAVSFVTVLSSVLGGFVSDALAAGSRREIRSRSLVMAGGYILSAAACLAVTRTAAMGFVPFAAAVCLMMFGVSWAGGVFWAIPVLAYAPADNVAGTAFCSGASNVPNPIAPAVVGVLLGSSGRWGAAWLTCFLASFISLAASAVLSGQAQKNRG